MLRRLDDGQLRHLGVVIGLPRLMVPARRDRITQDRASGT